MLELTNESGLNGGEIPSKLPQGDFCKLNTILVGFFLSCTNSAYSFPLCPPDNKLDILVCLKRRGKKFFF